MSSILWEKGQSKFTIRHNNSSCGEVFDPFWLSVRTSLFGRIQLRYLGLIRFFLDDPSHKRQHGAGTSCNNKRDGSFRGTLRPVLRLPRSAAVPQEPLDYSKLATVPMDHKGSFSSSGCFSVCTMAPSLRLVVVIVVGTGERRIVPPFPL
jgi:hypothetical protein